MITVMVEFALGIAYCYCLLLNMVIDMFISYYYCLGLLPIAIAYCYCLLLLPIAIT